MLFIIFFTACPDDQPNNLEEPEVTCSEIITELGWEQESPEEPSMSVYMANIPDSFTTQLRLAENPDSLVCMDVSLVIDRETLRYVASSPEPGEDIASPMECPNYLIVDAVLSMHSADGSLSEDFPIDLTLQYIYEPAIAEFFSEVEILEGTLGSLLPEENQNTIYVQGFLSERSFYGSMNATTYFEENERSEEYLLASWNGNPQDTCE